MLMKHSSDRNKQ